jgi:RNA-directed DNA polymerase
MRRFVLGWKILGCERRFNARIVNYADDFVICCKGQADEAMTAMREIMGRLKLTVNEEKTRICDLPEGRFDFLGYNFGRCYSTKTDDPTWVRDRRRRASNASSKRFTCIPRGALRCSMPPNW